MAPILEVAHLHKDFGPIKAVDDISFSAKKGEIIALLGPNGAGKSTLMNMIIGYLSPTEGSIKIFGENISDNPLKAKAQIGFLPEGAPLYPDLSVKQFLNYMAELKSPPVIASKAKQSTYRLDYAIDAAKIKEILNQKIETLSKGYLRRVGFAQSLIGNPPILLLDEPTDGLDPNQKEHIRALISNMSTDKCILISTHLLEEAETIATRIILINKGKIRADGSLKDILKKTSSKTLSQAFKTLTGEICNDQII